MFFMYAKEGADKFFMFVASMPLFIASGRNKRKAKECFVGI